ncbi:MAG TPA: hypothetical protein VKU77_36545 [Streptosporangiaceae bacterium]|nr:hypothetical protein [Streptosporangiaceae bacterium]
MALRPATQADGSTSARTRSSKTGRPADTATRCGRTGLPVAWSVVLRYPVNDTARTTSGAVALKISCMVRSAIAQTRRSWRALISSSGHGTGSISSRAFT